MNTLPVEALCLNSPKRWVRKCAVLALLIIIMGTATGLAAPTPAELEEQSRRVQQEEQSRRTRQQAEERQQRQQRKDVFLQDKTKATEDLSLPDETPSFEITTLVLEGERADRFPWAQAMLDKYAGRKIGLRGINLIVKRLNNAFIDRGFVTTRVLVPQQDLAKGTLRLMLVPGVIRDIRFQDPKTWGSWRTAFPARPGDTLNLRSLEQGLEQMKRVPSQDVDMQLMPGEKPGESDVVIAVKRNKPTRFIFSLDDSGSRSTGKLQLSQTFSADNFFGINDLLNVTFNGDAEREGQRLGTRGDSIYYSFPYGESTFTFSNSHYNYHQTIETDTQPFLSSGESDNLEFRISQLMHRDQTRKTYLEFSIIKKNSRSFINDVEIETQRLNTTAAKLGLSHKEYFRETTVDVLLAFQKGVSWFGAQADPATGPDSPTTRYKMWLLDASLTTPLTIGGMKARYSATVRAQYTDNLIYGAEYFSIGNRYTVRGFDGEQTLSAARGWYLRNELSVPLKHGGCEVYLGLDYGQVAGPGAEYYPGRILMGSAVGLRGGDKAVQYDVFVGWPLRKPDGFQTATPTLGFQLVYQL